MYCPKCGRENPEKQNFCTSCGLNLETVALALMNDSQASGPGRSMAIFRGDNTSWQALLTYAFVLIAAGILIGALGYKVLGEKTLGDVGTLVSLVGVLVIMLKGIFLAIPAPSTTTARESKALAEHDRIGNSSSASSSAPLPALLSAEPPSITEHTTKHLDDVLESESDRARTTQRSLQ